MDRRKTCRKKKNVKHSTVVSNKKRANRRTRRHNYVSKRKIHKGGKSRRKDDKKYALTAIMSVDPFFLDNKNTYEKYKDDITVNKKDPNTIKPKEIDYPNPYENHPYFNLVTDNTKTENDNTGVDNMLILAMPYNNCKKEYTSPLLQKINIIRNVVDPFNNTEAENNKNKNDGVLVDRIKSSMSVLIDPSYLKQKEIYDEYSKTNLIENFDNVPINHRTVVNYERDNSKSPDYDLRNFSINSGDFSENYLPIELPMVLSNIQYVDNKR